jgi:hypothetical protein
MALTANPLPSQVPTIAAPFDAAMAFARAQTLVATGYVNNLNSGQLDLGSSGVEGVTGDEGAGRLDATLVMSITAMDFSSNDESYWFALLGSNDAAFGNGNVEVLAFHDFAAVTAGRVIPTLLGASPAIPWLAGSGTLVHMPFMNMMQRLLYRYLRLRCIIAGTTPSVTLSAWVSSLGVHH